MKEEILDIAKKLYHNHLTPETATNLLLDLFSVSKRYSLNYLDSMKIEQSVELWAKDQDDALDELKKIDASATYIFISRL